MKEDQACSITSNASIADEALGNIGRGGLVRSLSLDLGGRGSRPTEHSLTLRSVCGLPGPSGAWSDEHQPGPYGSIVIARSGYGVEVLFVLSEGAPGCD